MVVAVLGAGGTIAPAIVRDLAEYEEVDAVTSPIEECAVAS